MAMRPQRKVKKEKDAAVPVLQRGKVAVLEPLNFERLQDMIAETLHDHKSGELAAADSNARCALFRAALSNVRTKLAADTARKRQVPDNIW